MFIMTKEWLHKYYGSTPTQEQQSKDWLLKYGVNVTVKQAEQWKIWKHLIEYQPNTNDIVDQCLGKITGLFEFETELDAHRFVNMLRVPLSASYEEALKIAKPSTILELGVGGDSAISTAVFLAYVEKVNGKVFSVDLNPLGVTRLRYESYLGRIWDFKHDDSVSYLANKVATNKKYDLIFIDTSHTYEHTMKEMELAFQITNFMLMDDALFAGNETDSVQGGVKRAIQEWIEKNNTWEKTDLWQGNTVLLSNKVPSMKLNLGKGKKSEKLAKVCN